MIIYLVYFAVSAYFAYLARESESRKKAILFSLVSIAIPVLLAGARDFSIGIDVENYRTLTRYWMGAASSESLLEYLTIYSASGYGEYIFALYIGLIGQLTGDFRIFLALSHLVIVSGVYIGAFRQRKHVDPVLVLLLFYLFFFSHSLNIIRQYMAMAILFAALADIEQKKYGRYCIAVGVAVMIHTTALLGLGPLLIYWVLYGDYRLPIRGKRISPPLWGRRAFIACGLLTGVCSFLPLGQLLLEIGLLPEKYSYYFYAQDLTLSIIVMGLLVMELMAVFLLRGHMQERSPMFDFFVMCTISYLILQLMTGIIPYGKRIASYFSLNNLLTISLLQASFKSKRMRKIATAVILVIALFYWWYMYILRNASETFPYAFGNSLF